MPLTIKDIARDTNLSTATISKYLNGKKISPENYARIEQSIQRLGYTPNKSAQTLRVKSTSTICILLPNITNYFDGELCTHIEEYFRNFNYSTIISSYDNDLQNQDQNLQLLHNSKVDGVILVPYDIYSTYMPSLLTRDRIPFVYLNQKLSIPYADSVTSANYDSALNLTKSAIAGQYTHIYITTNAPSTYTSAERIRGITDACQSCGFPANSLFYYDSLMHSKTTMNAFINTLRSSSNKKIIFSLEYDISLEVLAELNTADVMIPADTAFVSFDDDDVFSVYDPPITCVAQSSRELGQAAAKLLHQRISGDTSDFPTNIKVETSLICRHSTPHFPRASQRV